MAEQMPADEAELRRLAVLHGATRRNPNGLGVVLQSAADALAAARRERDEAQATFTGCLESSLVTASRWVAAEAEVTRLTAALEAKDAVVEAAREYIKGRSFHPSAPIVVALAALDAAGKEQGRGR